MRPPATPAPSHQKPHPPVNFNGGVRHMPPQWRLSMSSSSPPVLANPPIAGAPCDLSWPHRLFRLRYLAQERLQHPPLTHEFAFPIREQSMESQAPSRAASMSGTKPDLSSLFSSRLHRLTKPKKSRPPPATPVELSPRQGPQGPPSAHSADGTARLRAWSAW